MTASEKIKQIEALIEMAQPDGMISCADAEFLFKAFNVMREIAKKSEKQALVYDYGVDYEFDERMKE